MNDQVATPAEDSPRPKPVAYRPQDARHLYCAICARQETGTLPLTANEVRSDAQCHFCGGGILAIASRTLAGVIIRYMTDRDCSDLADNEEG